MAKRRDQKKGVFCLETASWDPGIRGTASVEHVLRLLKATERVPFLHFDVGTREELDFYLKKWGGVSFKNSHPVLYLGFHGSPGEICLGERQENSLSLEDIAERLEDKCRGCIVHFGSCSTLRTQDKRLNAFLHRTGALAVCGYRSDTDWLKSAAFEVLVLGQLQQVSFTRRGMYAFERGLKEAAPDLVQKLKFRLVVRPGT